MPEIPPSLARLELRQFKPSIASGDVIQIGVGKPKLEQPSALELETKQPEPVITLIVLESLAQPGMSAYQLITAVKERFGSEPTSSLKLPVKINLIPARTETPSVTMIEIFEDEIAEIRRIRPKFFQDYKGNELTPEALEQNRQTFHRDKVLGKPRVYSQAFIETRYKDVNPTTLLDEVQTRQGWDIKFVDALGSGAFTEAVVVFYTDSHSEDLKHTVIKWEKEVSGQRSKNEVEAELHTVQQAFGEDHVAKTNIFEVTIDNQPRVVHVQELLQPGIYQNGNHAPEQQAQLKDFYEKSLLRALCLGVLPDIKKGSSFLLSDTFGLAEDGKIKILDFNTGNLLTEEGRAKLLADTHQLRMLPISFDEGGKPIRFWDNYRTAFKRAARGGVDHQVATNWDGNGWDGRVRFGDLEKYGADMWEAILCGTSPPDGMDEIQQAGIQTTAKSLDQLRQFAHGVQIAESDIVKMAGVNVVLAPAEIELASLEEKVTAEITELHPQVRDYEQIGLFIERENKEFLQLAAQGETTQEQAKQRKDELTSLLIRMSWQLTGSGISPEQYTLAQGVEDNVRKIPFATPLDKWNIQPMIDDLKKALRTHCEYFSRPEHDSRDEGEAFNNQNLADVFLSAAQNESVFERYKEFRA